MLDKWSFHKDKDFNFSRRCKFYVPSRKVSKYIKKLTELHGERDKSTNAIRELNLADRINRQNVSNDIEHI